MEVTLSLLRSTAGISIKKPTVSQNFEGNKNLSNRENINWDSPHIIRYMEVYKYDLTNNDEFEEFRNHQANNINYRENICLSSDHKSAIVFGVVEVEASPETIKNLPKSVRRLYALGEFATPTKELESNQKTISVSEENNIINNQPTNLFGEAV
mgnify:CR=1 FL=1|jgi:hypothetical protein